LDDFSVFSVAKKLLATAMSQQPALRLMLDIIAHALIAARESPLVY
jgi:hypothetical protein